MATDTGGGGAYEVVLDSLTGAANRVALITEATREHTIEGLDSGADVGHPGLQSSLANYCARWRVGVGNLVDGTDSVSDRLLRAASTYLDNDLSQAEAYAALRGFGA